MKYEAAGSVLPEFKPTEEEIKEEAKAFGEEFLELLILELTSHQLHQ